MKIKLITIFGILFLMGCSRSSVELFELAEEKLKNKQPDLALLDLEKLINKYPNDSLASKALYKMFTIHLHWHHNLKMSIHKLRQNLPLLVEEDNHNSIY